MILLLGCRLDPVADSTPVPGDEPPQITSASVTCDADDARWEFDLRTERWTGGGGLWMSVDGGYVEKHDVPSVEAEGDGSADRLELKLTLEADFRDVTPGTSTAFNCGTPGLHGLLVVYARDGETVADCRAFGEAPEEWEAWGYTPCTDTVAIAAGT